MKLTDKEKSQRILQEGKIISTTYLNQSTTHIVEAFGHRYRIDDAYGKHPKITQYPRES